MNRKQHIKTLESIKPSYHNVKQNSIQYAIDHLSREWVSRKTHRKLIKMWENDCEEYVNQNIRVMVELKKNEDIIDELKADKDRLQGEVDTLWQDRVYSTGKIHEAMRGIKQLESDWEKASDKVSELETQRVWLLISTSTLLITLIICLFTR